MENQKEFMKNITLCSNAIDFTGFLSKTQKQILKYLLAFSQQGGVTADTIKNSTHISRQAANIHLKHLMDRGYVTREKNRVFTYFPKKEKIKELIDTYYIGQKIKIK